MPFSIYLRVYCKKKINIKQSTTGYLYGDTLRFTCDVGFFLSLGTTYHSISCDSNGYWTHNLTMPTCMPVVCKIESILNGRYKLVEYETF